jgi:serine/threonine protein phosphatase PrpC
MHVMYSWEKEDRNQRSIIPFSFEPDVEGLFLSDRGGREENQDAWGYVQAVDGSLILALADGLGGHAGGRVASREAIRGCLDIALGKTFDGSSERALADMFAAGHRAICAAREKQPALSSMCSTLVVLIINGVQLRWGHAGDVRLYLVRSGDVIRQTKDQSVPQMLVDAGVIQASEIRGHPDRNRLLQVLGDAGSEPHADLQGEARLEPGDFLAMASDGFWEWIDEDCLVRTAAKNAPREGLVEAEKLLLAGASASGPEFDNYTAVFLSRAYTPQENGREDSAVPLRLILNSNAE